MSKKILVPLDGSDLAERILVHVQRVIYSADAEVTLLQVVPDRPDSGPEAYPPKESPLAVARRRLEGLRDSLVENGAQATARVVEGDPATEILEVASELDPWLIAMSTHGRSGLSRWVRGSVAERVLRQAKAPLLLANPAGLPEVQSLSIKKILVPLDGSERSAAILPLAVDFAKRFDSELILLSTLETVAVPDPMFVLSMVVTTDEARSQLEKFAQRISGVPVRVRIESGAPAIDILEVARAEQVDLIAMTTHGRSGVSRWAYGSVAEHVLRHSKCPLLVKRSSRLVEDAGEVAGAVKRTVPVPAPAGL